MPLRTIKPIPVPFKTVLPKLADLPNAELFVEQINQNIEKLNETIKRYASQSDPQVRFQTLKDIYQQRLSILNSYPLDYLAQYPNYKDHLLTRLWKELKIEFSSLNISSLTELQTTELQTQTTRPKTHEFSEILSNMPQEKCEVLMEMLWNDPHLDDIDSLYQPGEAGFEDFQNFLKQNKIEFLGGGNSKNYKITPKDLSKPPYVLKVDPRMGLPRTPEQHLKAQGVISLAQVYGQERQVAMPFKDKFGQSHLYPATLLVCDYFPQKDLHSQIENEFSVRSSLRQIYNNALNRALQMGNILQDMQSKGIAFPDAKNSNWLINERSQLKIADTKSLLFIEPDGEIHRKKGLNQWLSLIRTATHKPSEFQNESFSADKMHCYMLGKNLYQMLTADPMQNRQREITPPDFDRDIFKYSPPLGDKLKNLLQRMTADSPADRPTLQEALSDLNALVSSPQLQASRIQFLKDQSQTLISQVAPFISEAQLIDYMSTLNQAGNLASHEALYTDLTQTLAASITQRIADYHHLMSNPAFATPQHQTALAQQVGILEALQKQAYSPSHMKALQKSDKKFTHYQQLLQRYQTTQAAEKDLEQVKNDTVQLLSARFGSSPHFTKATAEFIHTTLSQIGQEKHLINLLDLQSQLETLATQLESVHAHLETTLKPLTDTHKLNPMHSARQEKAKKIKEAFHAIPLADRVQIFSKESKEINAFKAALNEHRIPKVSFSDSKPPSDTETYKTFKDHYDRAIHVDPGTGEGERPPTPPSLDIPSL